MARNTRYRLSPLPVLVLLTIGCSDDPEHPFKFDTSVTPDIGTDASKSVQPEVKQLAFAEGYAGASVTLQGVGFGSLEPYVTCGQACTVKSAKVTWGTETCTITNWSETRIAAYLPHTAKPGTKDISLRIDGKTVGSGLPFEVIPPDFTMTKVMQQGFDFIKNKMRGPSGGIYTNYIDNDDPDPVYLYGHHVTAEHMGLMLWVAAALLDHEAFEQAFQYALTTLISPRVHLIYWAIDKNTGKAHVGDPTDDTPYGNTPLDDFRVVKGLIAGYMRWKDERYLKTALEVGKAMLTYCVSTPKDFPAYPNGLITTGYSWSEKEDLGSFEAKLVPINYGDLWTLKWLSQHDAGWNKVIDETVRLMKDSVIPSSKQFYNAYLPQTKTFSGDWEYQEVEVGFKSPAADKVKVIQALWIAIHLARIGEKAVAMNAFNFYKKVYLKDGHLAEYYNYDGTHCNEPYFDGTAKKGEARIYSQLGRLAYFLGDKAFGDKVFKEKVEADQHTSGPLVGSIGKSTATAGNADAWNTLESLVGLGVQAGAEVVAHVFKK